MPKLRWTASYESVIFLHSAEERTPLRGAAALSFVVGDSYRTKQWREDMASAGSKWDPTQQEDHTFCFIKFESPSFSAMQYRYETAERAVSFSPFFFFCFFFFSSLFSSSFFCVFFCCCLFVFCVPGSRDNLLVEHLDS